MSVHETAAAKSGTAGDAWANGHPDDGVLHAGLDDQLSAADSAAVADHVSRCAACRSRVAEAHGLISGARRIVRRVKELSETNPHTSADAVAYESSFRASAVDGADEIAEPTVRKRSPVIPVATNAHGSKNARASATESAIETTRPDLAKPDTPHTSPRLRQIPWNKIGLAACVVVVALSLRPVWNAIANNAGQASFAAASGRSPTPNSDLPSAAPKAPVEIATVAATTASRGAAATDSEASQTTDNGALAPDVQAGVAAFDSLVLTRRTCASQCDEFVLFVSSSGSIRYVVRARGGKERSADASAADQSLHRMSALISKVLFETSAVPASGRSVCTVFDDAHVPTFQLMVAHGSSRALHANSCLASNRNLLELGAQIDSLAGSEQLQKSLRAEK